MQVKKGKINIKNASFIAFYSRNINIFDSDDSAILFLNRLDGRVGFPGGMVDPGENIIEAAIREVYEEMNFTIEEKDIELICTHNHRTDFNVHLFSCEIPFETMKDIQKTIPDSISYGNEITGSQLCISKYFENFISNAPLLSVVIDEIYELVKEKHLFNQHVSTITI